MCRFQPARRVVLMGVAVSACLVLPAQTAVGEIQFSFSRVVQNGDPFPGDPAPFHQLSIPAIDNGRVVFVGGVGGPNYSPASVFAYKNGQLSVVADGSTPIPQGPTVGDPPQPMPFVVFGSVSVSGDDVAFWGGTPYSPVSYGIYRRSLTGGGVGRVANNYDGIPNTGDLFYPNAFGAPVVSDGRVAFTGANWASPREGGVYVRGDGAAPFIVVADLHTPVPGLGGNFIVSSPWWTGKVSMDGSVVAFGGVSTNGQGIYKFDGNTLQVVADTTTPVPGGGGVTFGGFNGASSSAYNGLDVDSNGDVAFSGNAGLYLSRNGVLELIADQHTPTPGTPAFGMGLHGTISIDGGNAVFTASNAAAGGLYAKIDGQLVKVVTTMDTLDGRPAGGSEIGAQAISGNQIVFRNLFPDGTDAIYVATRVDVSSGTVNVPGGGTSVDYAPPLPARFIRMEFPARSQSSTLNIEHSSITNPDDTFLPADFGFSTLDFPHAGSETLLWDVALDGDASGPFTIEFAYDPSLYVGMAESDLRIYHFTQGQWVLPAQSIDLASNMITVETTSLSPFAVGAIPEPYGAPTVLGILAFAKVARTRFRQPPSP